jgi:Cof subfamily protein (haloacid dehalogenase superfamily)
MILIKHIFSDMDGTLLQSDCRISEKNVQTIKESQIPFTLVSARSPMEMTEVIDKLDLDEPQIGFNGGLIFQKQGQGLKILSEHTLNIDSVKRVIALVDEQFPKVSRSFYDVDTWYVDKFDKGVKYEQKMGGQTPKLVDYVSLLKQPDVKVFKIMLLSFDVIEMKQLIEKLESINTGDMSIKQSGEYYLEITSHLAQKSRGIKYIQDLEKLLKKDMAAFGDGFNDLSMLEMVGTPVVMDNALEGVKEYGKYITKNNDEDGVAYGIKKFLQK